MSKPPSPSGILLIDKPPDITSHDVVAQVRRLLTSKFKVGHTGTLDPFATGLLIIAVGPATRLIEYSHALPKTYQTTITLDATSDTDDKTGKIKMFSPPARGGVPSDSEGREWEPTHAQVIQTLKQFTGTIQQAPPDYAAIKIKGKKMYEYARAGERVLPQTRNVTIHSIQQTDYAHPNLSLTITCSTGTYIRALARDLGQALGTGAYVEQLRRTRIGPHQIQNAVKLNDLTSESLVKLFLPPESLVSHLPTITLPKTNVAKFTNGQVVQGNAAKTGFTRTYDSQNHLIGIGHYDDTTSLLHPKKVL